MLQHKTTKTYLIH